MTTNQTATGGEQTSMDEFRDKRDFVRDQIEFQAKNPEYLTNAMYALLNLCEHAAFRLDALERSHASVCQTLMQDMKDTAERLVALEANKADANPQWVASVEQRLVALALERRPAGEGEESKRPDYLNDNYPHNWPEDFEHENGDYLCKCFGCGRLFRGLKRRMECKVCASKSSLASNRSYSLERRPAGEGKGESIGQTGGATIGDKIISRLLIAKAELEHNPTAEKLAAYNEASYLAVQEINALSSRQPSPNPLADLDPEKEAREIAGIVKSETYREHGFYLHDHTVERITRVLTARFRELKEGRR